MDDMLFNATAEMLAMAAMDDNRRLLARVAKLEAELTRLRPLVDAAREYADTWKRESGDYVKVGSTRRLNIALARFLAAARALSSPTSPAPAAGVLGADQVRAALLRGLDVGRERKAVVTWIKDLARQWHERYVRDAEPKAKQIREAFDDLAGTIERGNHRDPTFTWHMAKDGPPAPEAAKGDTDE